MAEPILMNFVLLILQTLKVVILSERANRVGKDGLSCIVAQQAP